MAVVLAAPLLEGWFTAVWTAEVLWLLPLLSSGASCFLFFVKNYMMPLGPQAYPIKIFGWPFFMG